MRLGRASPEPATSLRTTATRRLLLHDLVETQRSLCTLEINSRHVPWDADLIGR